MRRLGRRKSMLITGASGFLGRHVIASSATDRWDIVAPPSGQLDICDAEGVFDEITQWKPTVVLHLAYRRDDRRVIVQGSRNVARAASAAGARLVHLSTDVVFGGRARAYVEADPASPITDYGRWKADAETEVIEACPGAALIRTSLIYGTSTTSNLQREVHEAANGRSRMTYFTDEFRCPVHADDLAEALMVVAAARDITGPLHVAGRQVLSRADFARRIATWMGDDPRAIQTSTIADSGLRRPANVVLDCALAAALAITCRSVDEVLRA